MPVGAQLMRLCKAANQAFLQAGSNRMPLELLKQMRCCCCTGAGSFSATIAEAGGNQNTSQLGTRALQCTAVLAAFQTSAAASPAKCCTCLVLQHAALCCPPPCQGPPRRQLPCLQDQHKGSCRP